MTRRGLRWLQLGILLGWPMIFSAQAPSRPPQVGAGIVVSDSLVLPAGTHDLVSPDLEHPALIIRGSNITIDFTAATLRGSVADDRPDRFTGVAVLVDGGENVTIRNLTARGYKIGVLARHTKGLHITGSDLSYNWKAHLYSGIEHESLVDWLSYHHNEKDEWLEGGAGIYLADTDGTEIDHTTVVQGQNGLLMARSTNAKVWNNTFSYLSGVGLGLYRSSHNTIMHNRIDWCVRGYSHGYYNRGQDSAGVLVYEQSSNNVIAFNSVTHGGDGFFLWAGQSTMDSGEGGANDNVVYDNDFSFAATNGIEATFSRNVFYGNRVEECWHGLWGGYSFDSWIANNHFARNTEAIAIEHGQDNRITENTFDGDETAIHLWRNLTQDPDWGYPKHRDTRSRDYVIAGNHFLGNTVALKIAETQSIRGLTNEFSKVKTVAELSGDARNIGIGDEITVPIRDRPTINATLPQPLPEGMNAKTPDPQRRGRDAIIVDEWGPYDWLSPKLWPTGRFDERPLKLRVLGPPGAWQVQRVRGATIAPQSGRIPGEVTVTPTKGAVEDIDVMLAYRGGRVISPRGVVTAPGAVYQFGYQSFFVPANWRLRYFQYDQAIDLATDTAAFTALKARVPLKVEHRLRLDLMSGRNLTDGVAPDRVAILADADVELPAGRYTMQTISDDGIRVFVDDQPVIDHWTPHESAVDTAPLPGGHHRIRVEYYEVEGFAEFRLEILRASR